MNVIMKNNLRKSRPTRAVDLWGGMEYTSTLKVNIPATIKKNSADLFSTRYPTRFQIHYKIILSSRVRSYNWLPFLRLSQQNAVSISFPPPPPNPTCNTTFPFFLIFLDLITLASSYHGHLQWSVCWSLFFCSHLRRKYCFRSLIFEYTHLLTSLSVTFLVSHPENTTVETVILLTLRQEVVDPTVTRVPHIWSGPDFFMHAKSVF
jgi:hypothetical protein